MNKLKLFFTVFLFTVISLAQTGGVGIGTTTPDASAALDVSSTTKGFLPPRVTNAEMLTIVSPAEGLLVYNTGSIVLKEGYFYWNGSRWTRIGNDGWSIPAPITISAVTTAPTKGTIVYDNVRYIKTSETSYELTYNYAQSTTGTAGSGDYLFSLPAGLSFGSSVLTTNASTYEAIINRAIIGSGIMGTTDNSRFRAVAIVPYDSTRFRLLVTNSDNTGLIISSSTLGLNYDGISFKFSFILDTD